MIARAKENRKLINKGIIILSQWIHFNSSWYTAKITGMFLFFYDEKFQFYLIEDVIAPYFDDFPLYENKIYLLIDP